MRKRGGIINRKQFLGDPAQAPTTPNPEPTTKRGKRRSQRTEEYLANVERRKQQTYPTR